MLLRIYVTMQMYYASGESGRTMLGNIGKSLDFKLLTLKSTK